VPGVGCWGAGIPKPALKKNREKEISAKEALAHKVSLQYITSIIHLCRDVRTAHHRTNDVYV
jgi:hypothetical protein